MRASVPGTSESAEARLKASIPQMARVATDGSVKVDVTYSGDPKFEPIEGTALAYAVNSNEQVIKVGETYFVLKDGVWFTGTSPSGPWTVAKAVAEEIYKIPPSSPVYNATYVRVYNTEPDAVWFGYTMGYLGAYLAWDTFVYGTGWAYPPYWDFGWAGGGYWPYYPRPLTYGVGAFYNPRLWHLRALRICLWTLPGHRRGIGIQSADGDLYPGRGGSRAKWCTRFRGGLQSAHRQCGFCTRRPEYLWFVGDGRREAWLRFCAHLRRSDRQCRRHELAHLGRKPRLRRGRQGR